MLYIYILYLIIPNPQCLPYLYTNPYIYGAYLLTTITIIKRIGRIEAIIEIFIPQQLLLAIRFRKYQIQRKELLRIAPTIIIRLTAIRKSTCYYPKRQPPLQYMLIKPRLKTLFSTLLYYSLSLTILYYTANIIVV